jgi:hypothetical protein
MASLTACSTPGWLAVFVPDCEQPSNVKATEKTSNRLAVFDFISLSFRFGKLTHTCIGARLKYQTQLILSIGQSTNRSSDAIATWLLDNRRYPNCENIVVAVTTLTAQGKLLLNPSAVGIPENRYGDSVFGYQINNVTAADLRRMTTPFRPQSEREHIEKMSAD